MAKAGFSICHGGYGGVMEAVARGCHEAGGRNIGVTIKKSTHLGSGLKSGKQEAKDRVLNLLNPWVTTGIQMPSWHARIFKLIEMGDAYVFLDGATGTLNELFFVWEMTNKRLLNKPIILLGKRLRSLVDFLKQDPLLRIPENFFLTASIMEVLELLEQKQRQAVSVRC